MGGVTIRDVAKRSGVSITTVSRVINGSGYVKETTRQKVQEAVQALGFSPNHFARSLSSGSSRLVAAVFPDINNPFFPAVARGIDDALTSRGYVLVICNTDNDTKQEETIVAGLVSKGVDGIIFVTGTPETGELVKKAWEQVPVSLIDREIPGAQYDTVTCDSYGGAYEMTRRLLSQGHRKIAFISGPPALSTSKKRLAGFTQCLSDMGAEGDPLVFYGDFRYDTGYSLAGEILAVKQGVTAVFAANDLMGLGAMRRFTDEGVMIPAQMAVAGFDDIFMAALVRPSLSTVAQPAYRMGAVAAEMLLDRLDRPGNDEPPRYQMLEASVVMRDSTGGGRVQR